MARATFLLGIGLGSPLISTIVLVKPSIGDHRFLSRVTVDDCHSISIASLCAIRSQTIVKLAEMVWLNVVVKKSKLMTFITVDDCRSIGIASLCAIKSQTIVELAEMAWLNVVVEIKINDL